MYITQLDFNKTLDWFYHQDKYDLELLFVSSFGGDDRAIIQEIVNNAVRIDRITGNRICFFYFIKGSCYCTDERVGNLVKSISHIETLFDRGVNATMKTADDICNHFGILRSNLPAFILIDKNQREEPKILSVQDYNDLESFLTPLNILHSYIEDINTITNRYEHERKIHEITEKEVARRNELRNSWSVALQLLNRKKAKELSMGLIQQANERQQEIKKYEQKLDSYPVLKLGEENISVLDPHEEMEVVKRKTVKKLDIALNSHIGEHIINRLQDHNGYLNAICKVWELARDKEVRISRIIEKIRYEIHERGFDIFISCKSQDYHLADELYGFLISNGFRPFLADTSIKEVGIEQYTALIGEVINICQYMVVFATDVRYLETPYVSAEWHTFINDINTGHKPNAKIVSILSSDINPHRLPIWLRDKQCFTTDNYKTDLIHFLQNRDDESINKSREERIKGKASISANTKGNVETCEENEIHKLQYIPPKRDNDMKTFYKRIEILWLVCFIAVWVIRWPSDFFLNGFIKVIVLSILLVLTILFRKRFAKIPFWIAIVLNILSILLIPIGIISVLMIIP